MSGKRVKPFLYVVFSLFKVTSSSAERETETDRERQTDRQTDRQRQRDTETDRERWSMVYYHQQNYHLLSFQFHFICSAFL